MLRTCVRTLAVVQALLLISPPSAAQLLGHFGVISLPEGFQYRDSETVKASEEAARFGERFQSEDDDQGERNLRANRRLIRTQTVPQFQTDFRGVKIGTKMDDTKIFDRFDSNYLNPFTETRSNKPLQEILVEESTSPSRFLPGEGLPPTPAPVTVTRPPNRLTNLNEPVEESERSKNSRLGTIFDDHRNTFRSTNRKSPSKDLSFDSKPIDLFKDNSGRLTNLNEPVEESERSKNSQLGTNFDEHRNTLKSFSSPNRKSPSKDLSFDSIPIDLFKDNSGRLTKLNEPLEESERSKNSQLGTIFDEHRNTFRSFSSPTRKSPSKDLSFDSRTIDLFKDNSGRPSTSFINLRG